MLIVMPFCAVASGKGHRCEEEEDLGHVRPPNSAGGEKNHGSHTRDCYYFHFNNWYLLMLLSTSKSCIRNGWRSIPAVPSSSSLLFIWKTAADCFHFSSSIIHRLFLGSKCGKAPLGLPHFLLLGSHMMSVTHLPDRTNFTLIICFFFF